MSNFLDVKLVSADGERTARVPIERLIIAGWTGRDKAAVEKHIVELEELGVKRPSSTPVYYRVAAARVKTEPVIQASGSASSGEVEFVLAQWDGELWVGVGSDHTDRKTEAYDVTVSKQMCEKPISPIFWRFRDVEAHWDEIAMRSFIDENGERDSEAAVPRRGQRRQRQRPLLRRAPPKRRWASSCCCRRRS